VYGVLWCMVYGGWWMVDGVHCAPLARRVQLRGSATRGSATGSTGWMVYGECMEYGVWSMEYGVWCMIYSVWSMVSMVYGVWCMVYGVWCRLYDIQCTVGTVGAATAGNLPSYNREELCGHSPGRGQKGLLSSQLTPGKLYGV
jgi:hypothetical protein